MIAVESASVPSQSKTTKRNRRGEPRQSSSAASSGASSAATNAARSAAAATRRRSRDRRRGCAKRIRCACRNIRFSPCSRERLVPREIAVLVVAGQRKAEVRQVHADLVRAPGLELGFEQRDRRVGLRPRLDAPEDGPRDAAVAVDAHAPLALAGHVARATARPRAARRATCRAPARNSACRSRRRAAARAIRSAPCASSRPSSTPDVSRSSRCTSSRNGASGRAWRSRSITPNESRCRRGRRVRPACRARSARRPRTGSAASRRGATASVRGPARGRRGRADRRYAQLVADVEPGVRARPGGRSRRTSPLRRIR